MNSQINLIEDILTKTFIIHQEISSDTLFVDTNPAEIEILKVSKVNSSISKTKEKKTFKLNHFTSQQTDYKDICVNISKSLNRSFIELISSTTDEEIIEIKEKKMFGLYTKKNYSKILDSITYFNWVIIPSTIANEIYKLPNFIRISESVGSINKVGIINEVVFFSSNEVEKNSIICGTSDSITSVFLNDISIEKKSNIYEIGIDYLFNYKGIRKLILK